MLIVTSFYRGYSYFLSFVKAGEDHPPFKALVRPLIAGSETELKITLFGDHSLHNEHDTVLCKMKKTH